ncbi:threonine/serine exporter family protein [Alkaliphilus pronyensis]|uniref:Threonine/serine exporter family protein n=1 Tax=Alkaliphilus pronyensis TaxID=1482732 RepID=A0A6I0FFY7_9FIRM|nr:threonine/serine exporter family protein [Alkaliphilus pronyensis]KAB3537288.1 threonine/serine exporter family protein [Alkaliphilus pronyensis]
MSKVNQKKLLVMAIYAAEIMLKNGAETYRVEDTINRICRSRDFPYVESYVTLTGIFISVDTDGEDLNDMITYVKRINKRVINLNKVAEVNDFSRRFVESRMPIDEAMAVLKAIDTTLPYSITLQAVFGGLASGCFSLLLGANVLEFFAALFTSILVTYSIHKLKQADFNLFITNIAGGGLAAFSAIVLSSLHASVNLDKVIIGAIMVMVPGVAMTNAIRDSIAGDLVSGLARGAEALLIAISIAFGVGFILQGWIFLKGGILPW